MEGKINNQSKINMIHQYFAEESAAEDIQTVILYTVGFSIAVAVGWWIWNNLKKQTKAEDCSQNDSPFCVG